MDTITLKPPKRVVIDPRILKIIPVVDEVLDEKTDNHIFRVTWTDIGNVERDIKELTEEHLTNLIPWCCQRKLDRTRQIFECERERRLTGSYPGEFDEMIEQYKGDPEIWRLKIYD